MPYPEVVARIYSLAKGNPFFTEELTRATEEGDVALADHVLDAVRARVDRLGETVVRLLRAASVIDLVAFRWILRASELDERSALHALEGALAGRQLEESESGYRFRHALVREALYESITPARKAQLHRAVAAAIEEEAEPVRALHLADLAHHYVEGDEPATGASVLSSVQGRKRPVAQVSERRSHSFSGP